MNPIEIDSIVFEDGWLKLHTSSYRSAMKLIKEFKSGLYELVKAHKKRSRNANSYCWELATQIANKLYITKEEVYRTAIREVGACVQGIYPKSAFNKAKAMWESNGVGWIVQPYDEDETYYYCFQYYGSSQYDVTEMSRLIDWLVQDANSLGIETISDAERGLLIDEWQHSSK